MGKIKDFIKKTIELIIGLLFIVSLIMMDMLYQQLDDLLYKKGFIACFHFLINNFLTWILLTVITFIIVGLFIRIGDKK